MKSRVSGGVYLTIGLALAGSAPTAGMALSAELGPFTITFLSLAFALPVLAPLAFRGSRPDRGELARTALFGLFGIVVYRFCLVSALPRIGAGAAGLLIGAAPACTAFASWTFLGERPNRRSLVGVALASAGIILVNLGIVAAPSAFAPAGRFGGRILGAVLAFGAAASEAAFAVLSRRAWTAAGPADSRVRTTLTVAWALCFSAVPAAAERPFRALAHLAPAGWMALAWYGVFVTAVSYVCWNEGIRRMEASRAAAYTGIVPVVSLVLPALLLGDRPDPLRVLGCGLVAFGIAATVGGRSAARAGSTGG